MENVPEYQIFPAQWLCLSHDERELLAKRFSIGRSVATEIVDNRIVSDGRGVNDLKAITKEKMQEYINDPKEEDFMRLWNLVQAKARYELNPPQELPAMKATPVVVEEKKEEVVVPEKKVNGFRQLTEKENVVMNILTKNANAKSKRTKSK
jgi:hypothetical protein